ncbi:hypothetical protein HYC85_000351 [Camellia sinensis]|uniref:Phorbol-ester/DAG-type domain-containing protein n=1 Tax=Camellia sinensis TaxID=4442 RepID=A0A7J7I272_CAMSI|nr:hypothetical protein HYC85_000351 [Camellia sinensis]
MQIVLPQNPVSGIRGQHVIPPQPVDKPTVKKSQVCCPKCNRELKLKKSNKRFTCDGCMQDGFGSRNRCKDCNYDLHQECTSPEPTISPESCYACGKSIRGCFYHCKSNQLNLHPCCAKLKIKLCGMDFVHQDEVVSSSSSSECMWCKKQASSSSTKSHDPGGCSYVCTRTKFHFHVYCVTEMVHEAWKKGVIIDDSTNDISTALKEMNLQLMMPNSDKSTVNGIIETLKTVSPFVAAIPLLGRAKDDKIDNKAVHKKPRRSRLAAALPLLKKGSRPEPFPSSTDFKSIVAPKPAAAPDVLMYHHDIRELRSRDS